MRAPQKIGLLSPTSERFRHSKVEQVERVVDEDGRSARPYRTVDTLAIMERRGSITPEMRQAGEDFRSIFALSQLNPLAAADVSRPVVSGVTRSDVSFRVEAARNRTWAAILAVGGVGSPGGSCLWHVVGWEQSLKEWAIEQGWSGRRVSQEAASGILTAALGALAQHFAGERLRRA